MALSARDRIKLQKTISTIKEKLKSDDTLKARERIQLQKDMSAAFKKLKAELAKKPDVENQKLSDLIAGKYNEYLPSEFLKVIEAISEEIGSIEPVKDPTVKYIEANQALIAEE